MEKINIPGVLGGSAPLTRCILSHKMRILQINKWFFGWKCRQTASKVAAKWRQCRGSAAKWRQCGRSAAKRRQSCRQTASELPPNGVRIAAKWRQCRRSAAKRRQCGGSAAKWRQKLPPNGVGAGDCRQTASAREIAAKWRQRGGSAAKWRQREGSAAKRRRCLKMPRPPASQH